MTSSDNDPGTLSEVGSESDENDILDEKLASLLDPKLIAFCYLQKKKVAKLENLEEFSKHCEKTLIEYLENSNKKDDLKILSNNEICHYSTDELGKESNYNFESIFNIWKLKDWFEEVEGDEETDYEFKEGSNGAKWIRHRYQEGLDRLEEEYKSFSDE